MNEDSQSSSPGEPAVFRFIEAGMRLTYEFESIGRIQASLGQTIEFSPVFSIRGWSNHKEFIASLRLKHFTYDYREIGRCLLDLDEVVAWSQLLRQMQERQDGCSELQMRSVEYESRHGVRMVWQSGIKRQNEASFLLHVSSPQVAIVSADFISQLLIIFDDFELLCRRYR
jgi:hypothetical protein